MYNRVMIRCRKTGVKLKPQQLAILVAAVCVALALLAELVRWMGEP